jgi:hypothetical protein
MTRCVVRGRARATRPGKRPGDAIAPRTQRVRVGIAALVALTFVPAIFLSGCALSVLASPYTISSSELGGSLRLRDSAQSFDLSVRVTKTQVIDAPGSPPTVDEHWLGVHLTIRNLSSALFRDRQFYSCFYLVKSVKPATPQVPTTDGWSPVYGSVPPHTLRDSVTVMPGRVLDGWLWFSIQGKKSTPGAADFSLFHVLSFRPAGSSVVGMWQLRP